MCDATGSSLESWEGTTQGAVDDYNIRSQGESTIFECSSSSTCRCTYCQGNSPPFWRNLKKLQCNMIVSETISHLQECNFFHHQKYLPFGKDVQGWINRKCVHFWISFLLQTGHDGSVKAKYIHKLTLDLKERLIFWSAPFWFGKCSLPGTLCLIKHCMKPLALWFYHIWILFMRSMSEGLSAQLAVRHNWMPCERSVTTTCWKYRLVQQRLLTVWQQLGKKYNAQLFWIQSCLKNNVSIVRPPHVYAKL